MNFSESYSELQKRTLSEIEDMKRKMELVELGIPLGLICPTPTSETAMPTKAMPPIKTFLGKTFLWIMVNFENTNLKHRDIKTVLWFNLYFNQQTIFYRYVVIKNGNSKLRKKIKS